MQKNKEIKLVTVFSGIGAIEQALKRLSLEHRILLACDNGGVDLPTTYREIHDLLGKSKPKERDEHIARLYRRAGKNYVKTSYLANYKTENYSEDIRFVDGKKYKGVDLYVGGSPCQSFSISGKRKGFDDDRGNLFFEYVRVLEEMRPKLFIYENVPGILSHDKGDTYKTIERSLNKLDYDWEWAVINAKDHGIPQSRRRFFIVGFRKDLKAKTGELKNRSKKPLLTSLPDYLQKIEQVPNKYFHGVKGFHWVTKPLSLEKRVSINSKITRTQTANQQFNWCGDMVAYHRWPKRIENDERIYKGKYENKMAVIRTLTPRECLRLMGFAEDFKIVVPDKEIYKQSGNSIVVDVLIDLIEYIKERLENAKSSYRF